LFTAYLTISIVRYRFNMMTSIQRFLLCSIVTAAVSAVHANVLNDHEINYLKNKGEIVFVSQPQAAPFEFLDKQRLRGIHIELAQWMAADMGFKARFETAPLKEALEMLRTGKADAMTSLFYSPSLDDEFDFSSTIKTVPVSLFVRNDRNDILNLYDLEGRKVAIMASGRAMEVLQDRGIRCQIKFMPTTRDCVKLVASGQVDAMIGNELITQHYMYSQGKGELKVAGDPVFSARLGMAVATDHQDLLNILNKGIARAQKTGTLNRIEAKWLGSEYTRHIMPIKTICTVAAVASAVVAAIIALILFWNRKLQQTVEQRTRQFVESEERLRQLFENSPDAVFVLDRNAQIISANTQACESLKMEKQDLLSKRVHDLTPEMFHDDVNANMKQWFSGELKQCEGVSMASDGVGTPRSK